MRRYISLVLLPLLVLFLVVGTACRPGRPINTYSYTVPSDPMHQGMTDKKMHDAIVQGCVDRGWTPTDPVPGMIEATIVVRGKHTVVVSIPYSYNHYEIKYKSSVNMEYTVKGDGQKIHPNYNNWTNNLHLAIQHRVNTINFKK